MAIANDEDFMNFVSTALTVTLWAKIIITLILWALPFLISPKRLLLKLGMPQEAPMVFMRLLGAAYLALDIGYIQGLIQHQDGKNIASVVCVGIVSNGLASVIL